MGILITDAKREILINLGVINLKLGKKGENRKMGANRENRITETTCYGLLVIF